MLINYFIFRFKARLGSQLFSHLDLHFFHSGFFIIFSPSKAVLYILSDNLEEHT